MIRSLGLLVRHLVTVTTLALLPSTLGAQTAAQSARAHSLFSNFTETTPGAAGHRGPRR